MILKTGYKKDDYLNFNKTKMLVFFSLYVAY